MEVITSTTVQQQSFSASSKGRTGSISRKPVPSAEVLSSSVPPPPYASTPNLSSYAIPQEATVCSPSTATKVDFFPPPPSVIPQQKQQQYYPAPPGVPVKVKDQYKVSSTKRFFGDTLFGRIARSAVQSASTTWKMPQSLSPWGDNEALHLPNVRYRDAILFTTFAVVGTPLLEHGGDAACEALGGVADGALSSIVDGGVGFLVENTVAKYLFFQIVEQAIDKGILEHILPEEEKMMQTSSMKSLRCVIKHKLMDTKATLILCNEFAAPNPTSIAKGWFCPYLFASNRTPIIPRQRDFTIAACTGPSLVCDHLLAEKLLSESATVLSLSNTDKPGSRMLVTFVGLSPYRANLWSTSRRPGCAMLNFHLVNGTPALVIPVKERSPVVAWSPWTLANVRKAASWGREWKAWGWSPEKMHAELCEFLDGVVDQERLVEECGGKDGAYERVMGRAVSLIVNGMWKVCEADRNVLKGLVEERAGIAMFRF